MSTPFIRPDENDVLLGRGGTNHRHCGNEQLRVIAQERASDYRASTKKEKAVISRQIMHHIQNLVPPGRFLSKNYSTCEWEVVTDAIAREKVCQAFRDAVAIEREKKWEIMSSVPSPDSSDESFSVQKMVEKKWAHRVTPDKHRSADYTCAIEEMLDECDEDTNRYHQQSDNVDGMNPIVTPIKQEIVDGNICDEVEDLYHQICNLSDDFDLFDGELLRAIEVDEVLSNAVV